MTMDILTHRRDGVMAIEFHRPHKKNALTSEMYELLTEARLRRPRKRMTRALLQILGIWRVGRGAIRKTRPRTH